MPKVSVVMPVYNGEKYLREAIDSILAQTFTDWELIIVSEFGSNDAATRILKEYGKKDIRIRVIQNTTRLGIAESLNVGLRAAKGEYVARMDGDDISGPERLQKQVEYLDAHSDIGLLGIHPTIFGEENWEWYTEYTPEQVFANTLFFLPCLHPTVMIRKSVLDQNGLFYNPEYYCTEDYDLFERVLQHTNASNLDDQTLFYYRRYAAAATYAHVEDGNEVYVKVMDRALQRLSLSFSAEELSLLFIHDGCSKTDKRKLAETMTRLDLLLKQIFQKNLLEKRFSSHALFYCLHKRWVHMWECDVQPKYSWKDIPREVQDVYRHSIFVQETFCTCFEVEEDHIPKVTLLMPSYNGEKYIYEAIKSLEDQSFQDWELLIINDPSTDSTVSIIQEYQKYDKRIRLIKNKTKVGLAKALNQGIREAKGEYIARIDDDDIAMPSRLEKQVQLLEERQDISLVGSWQRHFGREEWTHQPPETPEEMKAVLLFNCDVCHSTIMFRKKDFVERGLFYSPEYVSEDYELWTRAVRELKFYTIQEVLGEYRVDGENITAGKFGKLESQQQQIIAQTLKELLHINVPQSDMILLSGWKNPFFTGSGDQKQLREREEELLQKIERKNEKYHVYDTAALNTTLNQRREWAGIIRPTKQSKVAMPKRTICQKIKSFIKQLLKPLYHPFRWRYEERLFRIESTVDKLAGSMSYLQKTVQDVDGHLYDYYSYLNQEVKSQRDQLLQVQTLFRTAQESIAKDFDRFIEEASEDNKKLIEALKQVTDTCIRQVQQEIVQNIDGRIWKAEQALTASTDARVWKAEKAITQNVDGRVWKAECFLVDKMTEMNQTNRILDETHRHIDFTYHDLMVALEHQIKFLPENDIVLETQYPVAYESLDHLYPHGTIRDNTRYPRFIKKCEELLEGKERLAFLDLGCSGGGMVLEAALRGHASIGLEGSDCSKREQRAEWRLLGDRLQTCDITKPFYLRNTDDKVQQFDVVTAWEVLEHIAEADLLQLFENIRNHLAPGGYFIGSIANWDDIDPVSGVNWHVTVHPYDWWKEKFEDAGFYVCTELFDTIDLPRGGYNPPNCYEAPYPDVDRQKSFHIAVKR